VDHTFKELFTFTSGEKKGLLILTGIIVLLLVSLLLLPILFKESETSGSAWIKELSQVDLKFDESTPSSTDSLLTDDEIMPGRELSEFDPNLATEKELRALGLVSWQIKIIEKFRQKGGRFRNSKDFGKIYGIGKAQFEILEPYIKIRSGSNSNITDTNQFNKLKKVAENRYIEINSCDSFQLGTMNGIGKSLAARIIKYRNRLGGFSSLEQLKEVYGFRQATFNRLLPGLRIDTNSITKLKINIIQYKELRMHPYISPFQAKAIIKYRELRGNLKDERDLLKNNLLDEVALAKIRPYLSFE
jgi:competence protein ComEA